MKNITHSSKWIFFVLILSLVFNINVFSQLSGPFTIGGTTPDYSTIQDAVDDLNAQGVNGPCIFNIRDGIYDEQITIGEISGVSHTNTVTFQSESLDSTVVTIYYANSTSTTNWVVRLDSCDYVTLQYLTINNGTGGSYARVIEINSTNSSAHSNKILNNRLVGQTGTPSGSGYAIIYSYQDYIDSLTIQNNEFINGSYSIYLRGSGKVSEELQIDNNTANCNRGIYLEDQDKITITNNTLNSAYGNGLELVTCDLDILVSHNYLHTTSSSTCSGVYLNTCVGSPVYEGLLYNNFILVDGNTSGGNYGFNSNTSQYQRFYNNTVHVKEGSVNSSGIYVHNGNNLEIINNNIVNSALGYAIIENTSNAIFACDHNNLYTNGNYFAKWNSTDVAYDLAGLKAIDLNTSSYSVYPNFIADDDLHVNTDWLNAKGDVLTEVTDDLDGDPRDGANPDIGADEFSPDIVMTYSGNLSINKAGGGNFLSFEEAIDSLKKYGVSGPVTINIATETYTEQISIPDIPGVDGANTITFQSATEDSIDVTLRYGSSDQYENYTVELRGADYITFRKMTISATGATYGRVFELKGYAHNNSIENNILNGSGTQSSTDYRVVVFTENQKTENLSINRNVFNNGSQGIYLEGISSSDYTSGFSAQYNEFTDHYRNIRIAYQTDFEISYNTFNEFANAGIGIYRCQNPFTVKNNIISSTQTTYYGMYISETTTTGSDEGLTYNNFIHVNNNGGVDGIYVNASTYQSFYYNSINILSTSSSSNAFYNNGSSDLIVKDNIFCHYGNGYAYYNNNAAGITESNFNNIYSLGTYIGRWGTVNCQTFFDFKTESGMDGNSLNIDPAYTSETDLHTNSPFIDNAGDPVSGITDDIDGDSRHVTYPDIGADEYTSTLVPLSGEYTIGATGRYENFTEAIDSLILNGINGPVLFLVQSDTYNEHFIIPQISGISETDTVVFQSQAEDPDSVIISYTAADADNNYIAKLDGADYITFKNMTFQTGTSQYGNLVVISGNAQENKFIGNVFEGRSQSTSGTEDACIIASNNPITNNTLIKDNEFTNGSYGIYFPGYSSVYTENLSVTNNTFNTYYKGVFIKYHNAPYVLSNDFTFALNNGAGIHIEYCESSTTSGLIVSKNEIYSDNSSTTGGIYINNSDASGSFPGSIINNVVRISYDGAGSSYGIYLNGSDEYNVFYNSVNISSSYSTSRALSLRNSNNINVQNNNLAIRGELNTLYSGHGYALYVDGGSLGLTNYNNFYSPNRYLISYLGTLYETLNDFRAISFTDANSVSYFPAFLGLNDLQTNSSWTNNAGTHIAIVTEDIDGNLRDGSEPDIGAYEYSTTQTPLSGPYTVGSGGNFPNLDSVSTALHALGISSPVTFDILDGDYNDVHLKLKDIPGANHQDTIVFQSETGNAGDVTLGYTQTSDENYIIYLNGTDYITFKDLTFSAGGATYNRIFWFTGNSKNVNLLDNVFNGVSYGSDNGEMDLVYIQQDNIIDSLLISGNTFNNASYGVRGNGYSSYDANDIRILNNTFNNQFKAIYLYRIKNFLVSGNEFYEPQNRAVEGYYCDDNIRILGNKIQTEYDNIYAIYLTYCDGTALKMGLIANNFVQADGTGSDAYGIYVNSCTNQQVYYNSVNITGTNSGSAFRCQSGGSNLVYNNAFTNTGEGYAYYCNNTTGVTESDYNNIYTTGSKYAYYNGSARADLAELQAASSNKDANSLTVNPMFTSETDLHLLGDSLIGKATVLAEVTTDFDNEDRDPSTPDIGADEFSCLFFPTPVVEDVTACSNDSIPSLYAEGSNIKWYDDKSLTTPVWTANEYDPGITAAGVYTYYVTQTTGECTSEADSAILTILAAPDLSANITHLDCEGTDYGTINLTVGGSTAGPFSYLWSNDEIYEDIDNLDPGDYIVTVEDLNGCSEIDTFTITAPEPIVLEILTEDTECDTSLGSATVVASGGGAPYNYQWTTGDSVTVVDNLSAGIYVVTVTDNRGCTEVGIATVSDWNAPAISDTSITDVSCYGSPDGAISLTITGGTTPYTYEWSNGSTDKDVSGIKAGSYEMVVTGADGCQAIESYTVEEPEPIRISLNITETSCDQSNGAAEAIVTGGTPIYTYEWFDKDGTTDVTASEISSLGLGVYKIEVTDANLCEATKHFTISQIGAPSVIVDSTYEGTCGNSDGAIYISVYGEYDVYTYKWSDDPSSTTQDLIGVNPGTYSVIVSDEGGCDAIEVATIEADQPPVNPICLVTVDSATNYNEVIWEKQYTEGVKYYNVYKETSRSDVYAVVGTVNADEESVFVDTLSDVMQRSWRYKLSVVDSCDVESDLSDNHKTMHLTINLGINNTINLIWDHYEGFDFETYYIHRRSDSGWELLDSVPNNLTSYTDDDPILDENLYYMIEIQHPYGCDPTKAGRNTSRSNITKRVKATAPDTNPPTAPADLSANEITQTSISLIWRQSTDDVGVTGYDFYQDNTYLESVTDTTFTATGLTASTTYSFHVLARDEAGNFASSDTIDVTTSSPDDTPPTAPANLAASEITLTTVNLTWDESTDNVGVTGYDVYKNYQFLESVTNTTYTATGLSESTPYYFYVLAKDAAGNSASSDTIIVTTTADDDTPPSAPANLAASEITSATANLTWEESTDNVGVTGYDVYKNLTFLESVTNTTYTATGLTASTAYLFHVLAKDAAGNSASSDTIVVTTLTTGIDLLYDDGIKELSLYPNPNNGQFIISIETVENREFWYEIYDVNGVLISKEYLGTVNGKIEKSIHMPDQTNGMYFVKIISNSGYHVKGMIKNR